MKTTLLTVATALAALFPLTARAVVAESWTPIRECAGGTIVTERAMLDLGRGEDVAIYKVVISNPATISYFQSQGVAKSGSPFAKNLGMNASGEPILTLGRKTTSPVFVEFDEPTRKSGRPFSATVRNEGDGLKVFFHRYDRLAEQTQAVELANWFFGDCRDL